MVFSLMRVNFKIAKGKFLSRFLVPALLLAVAILPCSSYDSSSNLTLDERNCLGNCDEDFGVDFKVLVDSLSTEEKISQLIMPVIVNPESRVFSSADISSENPSDAESKLFSSVPGGFLLSAALFKNPEQTFKMLSELKKNFSLNIDDSSFKLLPFVACVGNGDALKNMGAVLPDPFLLGASQSKYCAGLYASLLGKKYSALGLNLLLQGKRNSLDKLPKDFFEGFPFEKTSPYISDFFSDDTNLNMSLQRSFSEKLRDENLNLALFFDSENPPLEKASAANELFIFYMKTPLFSEDFISDFVSALKNGANIFAVDDFKSKDFELQDLEVAVKKIATLSEEDSELKDLIDASFEKVLSQKKNCSL